ncbi:alpha/beta fold hydrolase [Chondromyces crocatus]|uniref:Alpha/beta hydrolase n=1 Tax=Chondromyces crocatus TaxID=52 RepID=A0A0K1E6Q7_CHOCO|nr:alpha/beta hydrolase [Chondromyces crocatus]AKT36539.1 alpha/beta hydrolase [Chondromyces crocatus]
MSTTPAPLHHALVTAPSTEPDQWMLVLHGILGSGANWRTFARRVVEERPHWGLILVDLRAHGLSQDPAPPHTLDAAAADLDHLVHSLGRDVRGVMGHSFGGKVALAYVARRARAGSTLERAFVLDSDPGARAVGQRDASSREVLDVLMALPQPIASREAFLEQVQAKGLSRGVADWLAMNVRRAEDGFRLRLDLQVIEALLEDYFTRDLWPALEDPAGARAVRVVLGGRSTSVPVETRARLEALAAQSPRVSVRVLPEAGHWVHVDDPEGLLTAVSELL